MFITDTFTTQLDDLLLRICEKLQISDTDYQKAEERYTAVGKWLSQSDSALAPYEPAIYPQGSLRIGTTVKPIAYQEFDLDLVCELRINHSSSDPIEVLSAVEHRLRQNKTYAPMIERKNRCVRLNYANEFHMDILPAAPHGRENGGKVKVPDRKAEEWKDSNPKGYAAWFGGRTEYFRQFAAKAENVAPLPDIESVERKPPLKKAVQLIKRYRDVSFERNKEAAPISIVLTTLAGIHYRGDLSVNESMMNLLGGIVSSIPSTGRLIVLNPTNVDEDFSERWDEDYDAYVEFVKWAKQFRMLWQRINDLQGIPQITKLLYDMFGETVTNDALREQAAVVTKARREQRLSTTVGTGTLSAITGPNMIPVKTNTFFGS